MAGHLIYRTEKIVFNDPKYTDVRFVVGTDPDGEEQVLHAHSNVLIIECPRLYDQFRGLSLGSCSITVKNTSLGAFKELLKYIYFKRCDHSLQHYNQLLELSEMYEISKMKEYLNHEALDNMTVENVLDILQACLDNHIDHLRPRILEFVGKHYSGVLKSNSFCNIEKNVLEEILKIENVDDEFKGETELLDAVLKLVFVKSRGYSTRAREYLGDLVKLIRFPVMSHEEFVKYLSRNKNLLTLEEGYDVLFEICGGYPNSFGFSSLRRIRASDERLLRTLSTSIHYHSYFDFSKETMVVDRYFPKQDTVFQLSRPIVIKNVSIFNPNSQTKRNIKISIRDDNGIVLASGNTSTLSVTNFSNFLKVELKPFIVLKGEKTYVLEIECDEYGKIHYRRLKKFKKYPHIVNDRTQMSISFDQINPILRDMGFELSHYGTD